MFSSERCKRAELNVLWKAIYDYVHYKLQCAMILSRCQRPLNARERKCSRTTHFHDESHIAQNNKLITWAEVISLLMNFMIVSVRARCKLTPLNRLFATMMLMHRSSSRSAPVERALSNFALCTLQQLKRRFWLIDLPCSQTFRRWPQLQSKQMDVAQALQLITLWWLGNSWESLGKFFVAQRRYTFDLSGWRAVTSFDINRISMRCAPSRMNEVQWTILRRMWHPCKW